MISNRLTTVIQLARQAFGPYKLQIVALAALGFISGILEGVGINALIPLFSVIVGGQSADDKISQFIMKSFHFFDVTVSVRYLLIFVILLFIGRAIALVVTNYIKIKITADFEEKTRNNLFKKTLQAGWPYLLRQKVGYLDTIIMTDVSYSASLLEQLSSIVMAVASLVMYTLVAINISFYTTLTAFILGGILFLIFKPFVYRSRVIAHEASALNKQVAHHINENITGMKTLKAAAVEGVVVDAGAGYFQKLKTLKVRLALLKHTTGAFLEPVGLIFICAIFAVSYKLPGFNFAALAAIVYLIQRIFTYLQQLQAYAHVVNEQVPYLRAVLDYETQAMQSREPTGGKQPFNFTQLLAFKKVDFSYLPEKTILQNISFAIKKGEMVGLIGPSGGGKTTVVDLLLRLFVPTGGEILLDDKNVNSISLTQWRSHIGYVSQDMFLINDTVANNIKFYDKNITNADVERAAKMANCAEFIKALPERFNTIIGERGLMLSAGQRQRIVIARVLAKKPQLLVLDEATSALDNESEAQIQQVIEKLKGGMTVFVIAHRLSTVLNADRLLVLENGRITEEGTPAELLRDKQSYFTKVYKLRT
jgi:ATP-binding cassette subfamily C protein